MDGYDERLIETLWNCNRPDRLRCECFLVVDETA